MNQMPAFDIDAYVGRSRAVDRAAIDWAAVPRYPVPPEALRAIRFMPDIESHTIIFCAVHRTWGAINELTALTGYRRLAALTDHPVLADLLERIALDESRHFFFYYPHATPPGRAGRALPGGCPLL